MTAEERKQRDKRAQRLRWEKFRAANAEHIAAYRKKWAAAHPDREREYDRRQREKTKTDPRRLALYQARQERYRLKKNARRLHRYQTERAYREQTRARQRLYEKQSYARLYKPEGKRKCTLCGLPGHNRVRCGRVPAGNNIGIGIQSLLGGGGAPSVEERNGTTPPPAEQVRRPGHYLKQRHEGGAGPARVALLRDQIARGVYVPFAALRAEFAGAAKVVSRPSEFQRGERRRRSQAEASP
jgi:hypothetical protein